MRLLQAMAGARFGGAEAFFTRLAVGFQKAGFDQKVVIRAEPDRAAALRAGGVEPVQLKFGGPLDIGTKFALAREISSFQPDVVMTWMNRATVKCPKGKFTKVARLGGYYDLKYYKDCDHLIGNTQDIVDYLIKEGWPADKAHYLPNFVSAREAEAVDRGTYFTPNTSPLILALGRLHENKAFDTLLQAIARVPDVYLWIAGEGPDRQKLESLAENLAVKPRVRFIGWHEDVSPLFAAADAFICPSRHEPLGNVVLEAWAHGKPVIAADSYGPGTLIDHGETGLLCPVDDVPAMGNAIKWLLNNPQDADKMALNARKAFEADYTEAAVVEKYRQFFESVIA